MSGGDYERSDVSARLAVWTAVAMLVFLPLSIGGIGALMVTVWGAPERLPTPFVQEREPPAPRLQENPRTDLAQRRARWDERLNGYGWVDREAGIVHIPIERAMDRVAGGAPEGDPGRGEASP